LIEGRNPDDIPLSAATLVVVVPAAGDFSNVVTIGAPQTESENGDEISSSESQDERSAPEVELRSAEGGAAISQHKTNRTGNELAIISWKQ
jgi:hypothetical protein